MRIRQLYVKMFLAFIGLFLVAQFLVFGMFRHVTGRPLHREMGGYLESSVALVRELVEHKVREHPDAFTREVAALRDFVVRLGAGFQSLVWIETAAGRVVYRSSPDAPPPSIPRDLVDRGSYQYHLSMRLGSIVYLRIRVSPPGSPSATVHVFHRRPRPFMHDTHFLLGLIGICVLMALLLYPLTRYITRPLKRLTHSAHRIAGGDFDQVVAVPSNDEIGELAAAFNTMAERISHMIRGTRELTANVSHELRSPLARMRVALELLDAKVRDARAARAGELIASIEAEIVDMDRLIDRILELAKLDLREADTPIDAIDLDAGLNAIIAKFMPTIERRRLALTLTGAGGAIVRGVPDDIATALGNLVDNAVKYSPEGGAVDIAVTQSDGVVSIAVANASPPLADDELAGIFEPFVRLRPTGAPGHGLGLAIAKRIVERHGGSIRAERSVNGIRITITLPA